MIDPMQEKGQKTSVNNALKVYIYLEAKAHAASTGVDINLLRLCRTAQRFCECGELFLIV